MFFFKKIFLMMFNDENPRSEGEKEQNSTALKDIINLFRLKKEVKGSKYIVLDLEIEIDIEI